MSVSIVITGQIKSEDLFARSVKDFISLQDNGLIDQIIFSTWKSELITYKRIIPECHREKITVVCPSQPKVNSGSAFFQMKAFHEGLELVLDRKCFVFKTRPDLFISKVALKKIIHLDYDITVNNSPFSNKVWLPWFEISKPFYLADECFYCSYQDARKLFNYDCIYDNYYEIDAGISHIRRFIHPFLKTHPEFKYFLKYFGVTGHGTKKRFEIYSLLNASVNFKRLLKQYYGILNENFVIGLNEKDYIDFREWNESRKQFELSSILTDVRPENSFSPEQGQVYSYNMNILKHELNGYETSNFIIDMDETVHDMEMKNRIQDILDKDVAPLKTRIRAKLANLYRKIKG